MTHDSLFAFVLVSERSFQAPSQPASQPGPTKHSLVNRTQNRARAKSNIQGGDVQWWTMVATVRRRVRPLSGGVSDKAHD